MALPNAQSNYRVRDLVLGLGILLMGTAMVYLFTISSDNSSMLLVLNAFAAAGAIMLLAWLGGAACERLARRFPSLSRPRTSYVPHVIVGATSLAALVGAYLRWKPWIDGWVQNWIVGLWPQA